MNFFLTSNLIFTITIFFIFTTLIYFIFIFWNKKNILLNSIKNLINFLFILFVNFYKQTGIKGRIYFFQHYLQVSKIKLCILFYFILNIINNWLYPSIMEPGGEKLIEKMTGKTIINNPPIIAPNVNMAPSGNIPAPSGNIPAPKVNVNIPPTISTPIKVCQFLKIGSKKMKWILFQYKIR